MKGNVRKGKEMEGNERGMTTGLTKMYDWLQIDASQCKYYENTMRVLCETASNDRLFLSWNKKNFEEMEGTERK